MVGALTAAFLPGSRIMEADRSENYLAAAVLGTALMGIAGEEAEKISRGPGIFQVNLLDEIYGITDQQLLEKIKIKSWSEN